MTHPRQSFVLDNAPEAPDYSQEQYWAALPWTEDAADSTPDGLSNEQAAAEKALRRAVLWIETHRPDLDVVAAEIEWR